MEHASIKTKHDVGLSLQQTQILQAILSEMERGKEPTVNEIAKRLNISVQIVSKSLSPLGIRTYGASRDGKRGRYFKLSLKPEIIALLQGNQESSCDIIEIR